MPEHDIVRIHRPDRNARLIIIALAVLSIALAGGLAYLAYANSNITKMHEASVAAMNAERASTTARINQLESVLNDTKNLLQQTVNERNDLSQNLDAEKQRNDAFQNQIDKIGSTVGTLDKLASTDPELLKKYSKVYFLNENYIPKKLVQIDNQYLYDESTPKFMLSDVKSYLYKMLNDAKTDGVDLWIVSAYRSFDEQKALKGEYTVTYGSGANTFSADQGYSEHQLGTTFDFTTKGLNGGLDGFDKTDAYTWLKKNAYKYGFELSYPETNDYYVFEPWHWRFVGRDLARYLHNNDENFYDLDQRTIDTYLVNIFD